MDRRQFVGIAAAGALGFAAPRSTWLEAAPFVRNTLARPGLLDLIGRPEMVRSIGVGYRALHPEEDNAHVIEAKLVDGLHQSAQGSDLTTSVNRQVRDDFASGLTVVVKGWVLSVTEARQCALYSLLNS